jgi:hypothetical protein
MLFWLFCTSGVVAQNYFTCTPHGGPPPPGAIRCSQSCIYCDFTGFTDINNQFLPVGTPVTVCLGAITLENPRWYGFVAGSANLTIGVEYISCNGTDGLQAAVLKDCSLPVACLPGPNPDLGSLGGAFTIPLSGLTVGAPYQLVLDGLNGEVCQYELSVVDGTITPPPLGVVGDLEGLTEVCPNATTTYSIPPVANAVSYTWIAPAGAKINGAGNVLILPAPIGASVDIQFDNLGGNVCVVVSNACSPAVTRCLPVTNTPLAINVLPESVICYSEVPYEWPEEPHNILAVPGTYILTSSPYISYLGCDSIVRQKVRVLPLNIKNLPPIPLCEGECFEINGFSYCEAGTHQETLTSYFGCDSIVNFSTFVIPIKAVISEHAIITCAVPNITLSSAGSTTGSGVLYQWFNSNWQSISNSSTAVVSAAGEYALVVTNAQGGKICRDTAYTTVLADLAVPQVGAGPSKTLTCAVTSVVLQGSASSGSQYSYFWTAANGGNIVSGSTTLNPVVNTPGLYKLRVTNSLNGCTAAAVTFVFNQITPPAVTVGGGTVTCSVPLVNLSLTTNATNPTYVWNGPGGFTSNLKNPMVGIAGDYLVTVTDGATGCTAVRTAVVSANNTPPGASASSGFITCNAPLFTLNVNSSAANPTYNWTGPGGFSSTLKNPVVDIAGVYKVVVTGPNGCTSAANANVGLNTTPPGATLTVSGNLNCTNQSVNLFSTSNANPNLLSHVFTLPDSSTQATGNVGFLSTANPGIYRVLVTNTANGCTSSASTVVNQFGPVTAIVSNPVNVVCPGDFTGSALAVGSGGTGVYQFNWNNGTTAPILSAVPGGIYTVTVTDSDNCKGTAQVALNEPAPISLNPTISELTSVGSNDGMVSVAPSGGTPGYTYHWSDGSNTPTLMGLPAGFYSITVMDAAGCTKSQTLVVSPYDCQISGLVVPVPVRCFGESNGGASVGLSSGNSPFNYSWSTGDTLPAITGLPPGNYDVTITDSTQCPLLLTFTITSHDSLIAIISATGTTGSGFSDGTATAVPLGGTAPFAFSWTNGGTGESQNGLPPGLYGVTITDSKGCQALGEAEVKAGNCNVATQFIVSSPACYGQTNGSATIIVSGSPGPFLYSWSNGDTSATASNLVAGTYSVTISDPNECSIVESVIVTQPAALQVSISHTTPTDCPTNPNGSASVSVSGGTGAIQTGWSNGQFGLSSSGLIAGVYQIGVVDENGCTALASVEILAVDTTAPLIVPQDTAVVALGVAGIVFLTPQNMGTSVTDNCTVASVLSSPVSFTCSDLGYHTITLVATDDTGNSSTATFVIRVVDDSAPVLVCPSSILRCFGNNFVTYSAPSATDNCLGVGGNFSLLQGLPSGVNFPNGTTTTTYAYTDGQGNVGSCSFEVTILSAIQVTLDSVFNDIENGNVGKIYMGVSGSLSPYTYQWFKNGQPLSTTTPSLTGLGVGSYVLLVTDANGCTASSSPVVINSVVGTLQTTWVEQVGIFPNPTTGLLNVSLPGKWEGEIGCFQVCDFSGKRLVDINRVIAGVEELDLSELNSGIYWLFIQIGENQIVRRIARIKQ